MTFEDSRLIDFISDYLEGIAPLNTLLDYYDYQHADVADFIDLAEQLSEVLVEVSPSPAFVAGLYNDVLTAYYPERTWWGRLRAVPMRMKLAAGLGGITITAGMIVITYRSARYLVRFMPDMPGPLTWWRWTRRAITDEEANPWEVVA